MWGTGWGAWTGLAPARRLSRGETILRDGEQPWWECEMEIRPDMPSSQARRLQQEQPRVTCPVSFPVPRPRTPSASSSALGPLCPAITHDHPFAHSAYPHPVTHSSRCGKKNTFHFHRHTCTAEHCDTTQTTAAKDRPQRQAASAQGTSASHPSPIAHSSKAFSFSSPF